MLSSLAFGASTSHPGKKILWHPGASGHGVCFVVSTAEILAALSRYLSASARLRFGAGGYSSSRWALSILTRCLLEYSCEGTCTPARNFTAQSTYRCLGSQREHIST